MVSVSFGSLLAQVKAGLTQNTNMPVPVPNYLFIKCLKTAMKRSILCNRAVINISIGCDLEFFNRIENIIKVCIQYHLALIISWP